MTLTPEQVRFFRHNGFLKLPRPLPGPLLTAIREKIWQQIRDAVEPVVRNRDGRVTRISNLWDRDPLFREMATAPEVLDPLESLLGPHIELIRNRHNHATLRLAGDGGASIHRDILQWSRSIVTILFYLEDTTLENGCTLIIPGTHLLPSVPDLEPARDESLRQSGILDQALPVPMEAGGLLAIDSLMLHGPGPNRTEGTRMSATIGYHSVDELSGQDNPRRALVRGQRIYLGNDQ